MKFIINLFTFDTSEKRVIVTDFTPKGKSDVG